MPLRNNPSASAVDLTHVDVWVFDLDNTLYPAECRLFAQIDARMTSFITDALHVPAEEARRLQKDYYVRYGTTLAGLMREHRVSPEAFMEYVHDIDLDAVSPDPLLAERIERLPGRRYILTNGSERHAKNVAERLRIDHLFNDVFDIHDAGYAPKPERATYERFLRACAVRPQSAAMFEDLAHNLRAPHALGMTTVLVCSAADWLDDEPSEKRPARTGEVWDHVHYATDDLTDFLGRVMTAPAD